MTVYIIIIVVNHNHNYYKGMSPGKSVDISKLCQLVVGYDEEAIGPGQVA